MMIQKYINRDTKRWSLKLTLMVLLLAGTNLAHADCDNDGDPGDPDEGTECMLPPKPPAPPDGPVPDGCTGGDPVDCYTGIFIHTRRDIAIPDVMPLEITRTYRSRDSQNRFFGIGASLNYDIYLLSDSDKSTPATYIDLILADGGKIHYTLSRLADNQKSAIYIPTGTPGIYAGSTITYDGNYNKLTKRDGSVLVFSPFGDNTSATLMASTDRMGNKTTFTRDSSGYLVAVNSPNGRHLFLKNDANGRIYEIDDDSGRKVTYLYWPSGELKSFTDPLGYSENYTYDSNHNMTSVTDKRGNTMVFNVYDPTTARVTSQTFAKGSPTEASASFSYTVDATTGKVTQTDYTDERQTVRRLVFNSSGYPITRIEALGKTEQQTNTYNLDSSTNQVLTATDQLGRVTGYTYDANGNMRSRTVMKGTASEATWTYTYDPVFNQLTRSTDPLKNITNITLDNYGNPLYVTDGLGHSIGYTYDSQGRIKKTTKQTGAKSLTVQYAYSGPDLISITDPLSRTTTFDPDEVGRVIGIRDALGQLSKIYYDGQDQISQRCDAGGICSNFQFDPNGNLKHFDRGATVRDFVFDERNRLQTEGKGSTVETTYLYEPGGVVQTRTEASGRVQNTTSFDALGHPLHTDVGVGSPLVIKRTRDYAWDGASRLKSITDNVAGSLSYSYDDRFDSVKAETSPNGAVSYSYYANGLLQTISPDGGTTITYSYDVANRLKTISQAAGTGNAQPSSTLNVQFSYDDANRRKTLTLANGITLTYGFDDADQLQTMTWQQAGGTAVGDLSYGYDKVGRRTSVSGSFARISLPTAISLGVGSDGRIGTENGNSLSYDANGRLIKDATYQYNWDEMGQLASIRRNNDNSSVALYAYDPIGRRSGTLINKAVTSYLYAGANPIQIQDSSGNPSENLLAGGTDEWFARTTGGATQSYLTDAIGSTIRLTDSSGAKVVDYTYSPYGGTTNDNTASTNKFQYTGRENDSTGMYYYRTRYYKSNWGRFISQDPIGLAGGVNLYAYANGNPANYRDPSGNFGVDGMIAGSIVGGVMGGVGAALTGGNGWDIFGGAMAGFYAGAISGGIVGGLSGALAGGIGDLAGQIIGNYNNHKSLQCINVGEVLGATAGGFIGGKGGDFLTKGLTEAGFSGSLPGVIGGLIASGPALGLGVVGNVAYGNLSVK